MSRMLKLLVVAMLAYGAVPWLPLSLTANHLQAQTGEARPPRPPAQDLRVDNLSRQLEKILFDWSIASGQIHKLQGEHTRWIYDKVFQVQKVARGVFYYEAPDKGRIDIHAVDTKNKVPDKMIKRADDGRPYTLQSDDPERWICDGKQILQIKDKEKTVEMIPLPPEGRGQNIMEGPLPFLFGMPPEKAKRRFHLELESETKTTVVLIVKPRWQQDAANWSQAKVKLEKHNAYLPSAVQMIDPSGNLETVYVFSNLERNKREPGIFAFWTDKNPFDPSDIKRYKKVVVAAANPNEGGNDAPLVPSVIGLPAGEAEKVIKRSGYKVELERGRQASNSQFIHIIYDQQPRPKSELAKGQVVRLTYYNDQPTRTMAKPPSARGLK